MPARKRPASKRGGAHKSSRVKRTLIPRPSKWYREPIAPDRLALIDEREQPTFIAQERILRLEKLKQKIRDLRKYSNDFSAANGITLRTRELVRISASTYGKINRAADILSRATARPFVPVTPRTPAQRKSVVEQAGEIIPGQKRFLVHTESAARTKATFAKGELKLIETVKGGELYEIRYLFQRRPRSWNDVKKFTLELQQRGMRAGNYKLINTLYGDIGIPVTLNKLQEGLESYYGTYNRFMAGTILGWRWYGTSIDAAFRKEDKIKRVQDRFKETRDFQKFKEERRILEISRGVKVRPCVYCRKKKCECKAPEFK